ncbi:MAG: hypothetical protein JJE17_12400, partial [Peptostreptococcaceae bacterium]|nr:hypothetical protein [Peptostreptococcaceae bacterium]
EDPKLSLGDVIELANGNCYVHFSEMSNDASIVVNNECNEACINCPQIDRRRNPELKNKNLQLIRLLIGTGKNLHIFHRNRYNRTLRA